MNIRTKIWLLPIGVGVAFALSGALNLGLSARSATHLETLRSIDNPYLERTLRVERGIDELRTALQYAVGEGDASKLDDAERAIVSVHEALDGLRMLEGKAESAAALGAAFDAYQAAATATAHALLAKKDVEERLPRMQAARQVLNTRIVEQERVARAALEARFSDVAEAQRLGQWASALTALLVLVGLGLGSFLIVDSVWHELQAAHNRLLAAARQAGMAEIATNVLHNVGNVLNSVNVSAGLLSTRLGTSKVKGLARAVRLLDEHAGDLGAFLADDARGRLLPTYLRELAQALESEHVAMAEELGALAKSVDHIKEIVATQQSYAGTARVVEWLDFDALVDDALRLNAGALTRHKVDVVKHVAALPVLPLDRHRLLQILVNLISNAKHAMDGRTDEVKPCITLSAGLAGELLRITITDNGEGIAAENLTRIFSHGFTTRKNGHGFGLHSCVLAAQEMGGSLRAHSAGPGQGATFTLDLPVAAGEAVSA